MLTIRLGLEHTLVLRVPRASGQRTCASVRMGNRSVTRVGVVRLHPLRSNADAGRAGYHILRRRIEKASDGPSINDIKYLLVFTGDGYWWQLSPTKVDVKGTLFDPFKGNASYSVLRLPPDIERILQKYPNVKEDQE